MSTVTVNTTPISKSYFGMTIENVDYNFSYLGGPVEAFPTIPVGVVRSWDVWSPGNQKVEYLDWSHLNPSAGVYDWTGLNAWIATNQANNAQMVYTFGSPPAWAGGTTTNLADFQAFVTGVVTQANGAIKYWEGFNEFDVSGIAPATLVQLQEIIYNTVHALDPGALVLSPTVCGAGDDALFAQFLADGGGKYFDIAAFHGYNNSTGEGIIPVVQDFQAMLAKYGLSNVPIWDTEWGMEAPTTITDPIAQEAYVSTGLILQAALGVQTEMFYAYDNANSSLYDEATGKLTAAGVAYQQTEQWLIGAIEPSGYQLNGTVYTVQLNKNGQSDLIVWNAAGPSTYAAGAYSQYVDAQGVVHAIVNGQVTIGTVPILLETPVLLETPGIFTGIQAGILFIANSTTLEFTGAVNNTGTIALNATGNGADLAVVGTATLTGTGKVTLSNNVGNDITSNGASATLTNVNNTISGAGTIGDSNLTLINQGTINANGSLALVINTGSNTITNSGILEGTSSGGLDIDSNVNNSKTIEALGTNAKVVIQGVITDTATGLILASGSGAQVDLNNVTIVGGKLQTSGSTAFIETVSGSADTLVGVTISSGSTIEINAGSTLTLGGKTINSGTLLVNGGTLDVAGVLTGGTAEIGGAGRMEIAQASSENVAFLANSTGQLVLDQSTGYTGQISGLGTTQSIDLSDIDFAAGVKISYASNNKKNTSGVLTITDGTHTTHLEMQGSHTLANYKIASDGAGGTLLTDPTVAKNQLQIVSGGITNGTALGANTSEAGSAMLPGATGPLSVDQSSASTQSGIGAQNGIELPGIAFGAQTTLGYSPNSNNIGGTLSFSAGANSAQIALLGSYMASSFVMESGNQGDTLVGAQAAQSGSQTYLTNPQHA